MYIVFINTNDKIVLGSLYLVCVYTSFSCRPTSVSLSCSKIDKHHCANNDLLGLSTYGDSAPFFYGSKMDRRSGTIFFNREVKVKNQVLPHPLKSC